MNMIKISKIFPFALYMLHVCLSLPILEMMNSYSVNVSLVPSLQLDISLSLDYLAHMKPS